MQTLSLKTGAPPGTMMYVGRETEDKVRLTLIEYNEKEFYERDFYNFGECLGNCRPGMVKWINVDGIHNVSVVEEVGKHFNIHPLTLEDIVNTNQRPKFEDFDHYTVSVMKMIYEDPQGKSSETDLDDQVISEQLTIILLGDNTVISFQEAVSGDVFDIIRQRLRQGKGRVRKAGADYLAYCLIDAVIDSYFEVLEKVGDEVEKLEEQLLEKATPEVLSQLHHMKRHMVFIRKAVWPVRDMISNLERSGSDLISETTLLYLRDAHDHTIRVIDTVETYRDLLSGMMDLYMSNVSNRMNEVMKTLTIITTIFVPLTFIAGIYGMNFSYTDPKTGKVLPLNMPELYSPYGYVLTWGVMIVLVAALVFYFRRKKWL